MPIPSAPLVVRKPADSDRLPWQETGCGNRIQDQPDSAIGWILEANAESGSINGMIVFINKH